MTKTVSIVAGGYLGQRLADALVYDKYRVKLSYRSKPPKQQVYDQKWFYCELNHGQLNYDKDLLGTDCLVICIPPGFKQGLGEFYPTHIQALVEQAHESGVNQVIFTSSVGVYPERGIFSENYQLVPVSNKQQALFQAEQAVLTSRLKYKQVLRLAGLIGAERHPGRFKVNLNGERMAAPVNMVMVEDVVNAIKQLIAHPDSPSNLYNLVAPHHPAKSTFYRFAKQQLGTLDDDLKQVKSPVQGKTVDGSKIEAETDFVYSHRDLYKALTYI